MLHILSDKKNRYFHNQFIDQTRSVLLESIKKNQIVGHTDNYIEVRSNIEPESINKIREVKLYKNCGKYVEGKILLFNIHQSRGKYRLDFYHHMHYQPFPLMANIYVLLAI